MSELPPSASGTEDLIGRILARLSDAEAAIAAGHPADLDDFDAEVQEVVNRVRSLPKEQAVFFLGSLQDLVARLGALEGSAMEQQAKTEEQLHPKAEQAYKNSKLSGADSDGQDNSGD